MAQDGPQTPPRRPKAPILEDFGLQLGGFLDPTWWILETILVDFLQNLGSLLVEFLLIVDGLLGCLVARYLVA